MNFNVHSHPQAEKFQAVPTSGCFKPNVHSINTHTSHNPMSTKPPISKEKHPTKTSSNIHSIIPPPRNTGKSFKRIPAPETLIWINEKEDFEVFYERFTAFIGQQSCLQYILEDKFHAIYLQFGQNKYMTLGLANTANIHPTVKYVSEEQL